jgi:hypothetical protein
MRDPEREEAQPGLFETRVDGDKELSLVKFALGEFQKRGFELAGRRLALDRLLGALRRAFEEYQVEYWSDDQVADAIRSLGAEVEEVPEYVAKHPYRVIVNVDLANECLEHYLQKTGEEKP